MRMGFLSFWTVILGKLLVNLLYNLYLSLEKMLCMCIRFCRSKQNLSWPTNFCLCLNYLNFDTTEYLQFWKMVEGTSIATDIIICISLEVIFWALLLHNSVLVKLLYWSVSADRVLKGETISFITPTATARKKSFEAYRFTETLSRKAYLNILNTSFLIKVLPLLTLFFLGLL